MHKSFKMLAAGFAVVLAGATAANAFVLEPKGPLAKWRTDIVKANTKYTVCLLTEWNKCESGAAKDGSGSQLVDCNIAVDPALGGLTTGSSPKNPTASLLVTLNNKIDTVCDPQVSQPLDAKKGYSKFAIDGFNLSDIGCTGDCQTPEGNQPCANVIAYEAATVEPAINQRKTAVTIGSALGSLFCAADSATNGANVSIAAGRAVKYIQLAGSCQQKCQDDLINKAGNGFLNDTTNCIIGVSTDSNFTGCITKAVATSKVGDPIVNCTLATPATLTTLLSTALNDATNSSYDRVDLEAAYLGGVLGAVGAAFFPANCAAAGVPLPCCTGAGTGPACAAEIGATAVSLGARSGAGVPAKYGQTCAVSNNNVLEDYEECDGTNNKLCGVIPGTIAGNCGVASNPFPPSGTGGAPGRCPRS